MLLGLAKGLEVAPAGGYRQRSAGSGWEIGLPGGLIFMNRATDVGPASPPWGKEPEIMGLSSLHQLLWGSATLSPFSF